MFSLSRILVQQITLFLFLFFRSISPIKYSVTPPLPFPLLFTPPSTRQWIFDPGKAHRRMEGEGRGWDNDTCSTRPSTAIDGESMPTPTKNNHSGPSSGTGPRPQPNDDQRTIVHLPDTKDNQTGVGHGHEPSTTNQPSSSICTRDQTGVGHGRRPSILGMCTTTSNKGWSTTPGPSPPALTSENTCSPSFQTYPRRLGHGNAQSCSFLVSSSLAATPQRENEHEVRSLVVSILDVMSRGYDANVDGRSIELLLVALLSGRRRSLLVIFSRDGHGHPRRENEHNVRSLCRSNIAVTTDAYNEKTNICSFSLSFLRCP